jgi:PTH2 family peptidyl-tRNA hydrolase
MMDNTKQVIVIRKDLNMSKGKMCAQASHASMAFLTKNLAINSAKGMYNRFYDCASAGHCFREEIQHWLSSSFRKICVYVNSEEELMEVHQKALDVRLMSHLIEDNGATEFKGVKTKTCIAIGPHWDEKFNGITDKLCLL